MENQFWEQNFKTEGSTNGYLIKKAVERNQPKGRATAVPPLVQAHQGCGRTLLGAAGLPAAPMVRSHCSLPPLAGASLYKSREPGVEALLTLTLSIFTPSHSHLLHHLQKYFPQSLSSRKLCRKILHSSPRQARRLFDLFSLT